jgi:hypothetical protein
MDIVYIGCGNRNLLINESVTDDKYFKLIEENKEAYVTLIDANPFVVKILKDKCKNLPYYNRLKFLNLAILPIDTYFPVKFFIPTDEKFSDFGSVNPVHVVAHTHNNQLDIVNTESISLNRLLKDFTSRDIKYLILDLEGLDVITLFSLDFNQIKIDNIIFEYIHSDGIAQNGIKLQALLNILKVYGYSIDKYDDYNLIATKNLTK